LGTEGTLRRFEKGKQHPNYKDPGFTKRDPVTERVAGKGASDIGEYG
jgi:hypothetical protein